MWVSRWWLVKDRSWICCMRRGEEHVSHCLGHAPCCLSQNKSNFPGQTSSCSALTSPFPILGWTSRRPGSVISRRRLRWGRALLSRTMEILSGCAGGSCSCSQHQETAALPTQPLPLLQQLCWASAAAAPTPCPPVPIALLTRDYKHISGEHLNSSKRVKFSLNLCSNVAAGMKTRHLCRQPAVLQ